MSKSEIPAGGEKPSGPKFVFSGWGHEAAGRFVASGLGSRGGPNKPSNKLRSGPGAYLAAGPAALERFIAAALRSRGGPNKPSNKLRARPAAYRPPG
jgi:hypothetical protein